MTGGELALVAGAAGLAYLLGSIPFGVIFGRLRGVDVTRKGSGNIGATNVARTVGKKLALVVLVLDAAKGAAPLAVGLFAAAPALPGDPAQGWWTAGFALGLAPVLGHCFCPWLRFRGGKGVASSLGVILVISPAAAGIAVVLFAGVYAIARAASVGSLAASLVMPGLLWLLGEPAWTLALTGALAAVIIIQHRGNIRRLLSRSELRL